MKTDLCEKCGACIEEAPGGCGCKAVLHSETSIYWHPEKKLWISKKEMENDKYFKNKVYKKK